ncbi:uncharacterized protein M437DRAFT_50579 [Aureobasidium melanogenum CBS 110374]|uniref:BZIP domain-containing protein n=1 Tax=Aureobasidium melanogenum (strain CBS 110374) TaxID=1043003 RepID=A0A074WHL4_AURM1|nr:uncharacterized protein M437DRAFT_50579 [Aureobasidium melanogenum CBS 110374]KEQ61951.1 hypothetical protein M437DRAFT_50579 [Aureobasidium melanogenum CBS 110374]
MSPTTSSDTTGFEGYPGAKYENSPFPGSLPSDQALFPPHSLTQGHHVSASPQASLSPPTHADWMDMTGPNKPLKSADVKPIKPRHQPLLRRDTRDGIRKKNAKIPIPSEITLENIDDLIEGCTDEDEMKQLKAQKRLLRNREAALASRQRKKKHTENLEQKEKHLETKLLSLHQQIDQLRLQVETAESQKQFFISEHSKAHTRIQAMQLEKEELICNHTKETSRLRGQINWYREQLEATSPLAPAMSAAPSSTGFTDFNLEMDHLAIGDQRWDQGINVHGIDDLDYLGDTAESFATIQPAKRHGQQQEQESSVTHSTEQPIASGILFMLLLCGAFVASRSSSTAKDTAQNTLIPKMPEEVRAASTEVLNNLLKENPNQASLFLPEISSHRYTQSWPRSSNTENLHKHLTSPSALQEAEQAFAMTPDQYNALTTYPHMDTVASASSSQTLRPNLAETLGRMREARGPSAADVYTRSLLWDTIPEDVVKAFKRAVAQRHEDDEQMNDGNDGL